MEDEVWWVVSNGNRYRLRNSVDGLFYTELTDIPFGGAITVPKEFKSKEEAEVFAKNITWRRV